MTLAEVMGQNLSIDDWPSTADYAIVIGGYLHWVGGNFAWQAHHFLDREEFKILELCACSKAAFLVNGGRYVKSSKW